MLKKPKVVDPVIPFWWDFEARREIAELANPWLEQFPRVEAAGEIFEDRRGVLQRMFDGTLIYAGSYYGEWMSELIKNTKGYHEPQEEIAFHKILSKLKESSTILELGCYWGYYSTSFLRHIKNGRALLCEPSPNNLGVAMATTELNDVRAEFYLCGVGDLPPDMSRIALGGAQKNNINIPVFKVEEIIEKFNLESINILHSDIQGSETKMLRESENFFRDHRAEYIFLSTHTQDGHAACLDDLRRYEYKILCEHDLRSSYSSDGLIVAASRDASYREDIDIAHRHPEHWAHDEKVALRVRRRRWKKNREKILSAIKIN